MASVIEGRPNDALHHGRGNIAPDSGHKLQKRWMGMTKNLALGLVQPAKPERLGARSPRRAEG